MKKIEPFETDLVGKWFTHGNSINADDVCKRIEWLTLNILKEVARDPSGWDILYQDPNDCRYWELIYPNSEMNGGGPPTLGHISKTKVQKKYRIN